MEETPSSSLARIEPENPSSQLSITVPLVMPLDFRAEPQTMYIIPKDRLKSLKEVNTETQNSKYFGATFAIFLTLLPLILTRQIQNIYLFAACCGLCFFAGLLALFFHNQDNKDRRRRNEGFEEIEKSSQTVVSFTPPTKA